MAHLHAIAAMSENRVIGLNGKIPWHLPEDYRWFKRRTMGGALIMGRKTCDSLPGPLPGRENLVLTRDPSAARDGFVFFTDITALLKHFAPDTEAWLIGGGEIYALLLSQCERLYLTRIKQATAGTVLMPAFEDEFVLDQTIHENADFRVERWLNRKISAPPQPEAWPF